MNIYDIAKEAGVSISTVSRVLNNKSNVREDTRKRVEAVLVGSIFNTLCKAPEIGSMLGRIPMVLANGRTDTAKSYSVLMDDRYGVALAVDHLVKRGCRELYYLKDMDTVSAQLKCEGFLSAVEHAGIAGGRRRIIDTSRGIEGGMKAVEQILESGKQFDGIVCGEDITAVGAVKAVRRAGFRIPADVAVTGYNNSEYARVCEPPLTTIDNKPELVAMLSVQLLTSLIEDTDAYSSCTIQPELVRGGTA